MKLASTQNPRCEAGFVQAVLRPLPNDGGLYQPVSEADLSPWILHMDETSAFSAIAGTLTSALLNEELSPAVCERLAFAAFADASPVLRQLDDSLYLLELYHTPTATHQDFGMMWLASALEHILTMRETSALVLASANRSVARSLGNAFAGKKRLKLVLISALSEGGVPLDPSWLAWNGGNILPLTVSAPVDEARRLIRAAYSDPALVESYRPTLANTSNIGRLIPQIFFYIYAFSRLKKTVRGDIFYSVPSANYATLVAGLYAWKYSLPVNAFITDSSPLLCCDAKGESLCMDYYAAAALSDRAEQEIPSNIKRLEQVFALNPLLLKGFVFPFKVAESGISGIQFDARKRHGVWLNSDTAKAFGAAMEFRRTREGSGVVVVFANKDPAFELESVRKACGDAPEVSEAVQKTFQSEKALELKRCDIESLKEALAKFLPA